MDLSLLRSPFLVLGLSFFTMWVSAKIGGYIRKREEIKEEGVLQDRDLIVASTLTLLALLIGFSFSMANERYSQRKNYEEAEANAIGTEWVRVDLLPPADTTNLRKLLKLYLDQRILFYETRGEGELREIDARTMQLQSELWAALRTPSLAQPTCVTALVVSGMNDVLNSQGYAQAAWWNRIPGGAWALMIAIAICSNLLVGIGGHLAEGGFMRLLVLPIILSIAFFLIADIDSPRRGVIKVIPQNLVALANSLPA
jgi:hypothetical protein